MIVAHHVQSRARPHKSIDAMSPDDAPAETSGPSQHLTKLLDGRIVSTDMLFSILHEDLHRMALAIFAGERPNQTLQPTALVSEAYLRLVDQRTEWQNREHFFAVVARSMRRVLADYGRTRQSERRGGDRQRVTLADLSNGRKVTELDISEVEEALQKLGQVSERLVRVAELRLFTGLDLDATGRILGISRATAVREWAKARLLLSTYTEGLDP